MTRREKKAHSHYRQWVRQWHRRMLDAHDRCMMLAQLDAGGCRFWSGIGALEARESRAKHARRRAQG